MSLRMTLDFPPKTLERLDRLKRIGGFETYLDVLRAALKTYEAALEARQRGADVLIIEADDQHPAKAKS